MAEFELIRPGLPKRTIKQKNKVLLFENYNKWTAFYLRKIRGVDLGHGCSINRKAKIDGVNPRGVSIDVFPVDNVPDNKIKRYFKRRIAFLLRSIALCVKICKTRKYDKTRKLMTQTLQSALFYYTCLIVGFLFSYRSMFSWSCLFDKYVKEPGTTHDVTIPTGRAMYNG